eukprot:scaffold298351_cov40-Prasinocladus_malaysianus.AAC.1
MLLTADWFRSSLMLSSAPRLCCRPRYVRVRLQFSARTTGSSLSRVRNIATRTSRAPQVRPKKKKM